MSTRAVYTFKDSDGSAFHVYKHHDGYPTGAAQWLIAAKALAWPLPRYEADDFAAAFVAANKLPYQVQGPLVDFLTNVKPVKGKTVSKNIKVEVPSYGMSPGGGVRLMPSGNIHDVAPSDIEYRYEIMEGNQRGTLRVNAYATNYWDDNKEETLLFNCDLDDMEEVAKNLKQAA